MSAMIFINNKYTHWYNNIVLAAQNRNLLTYTEKHHIVPKSLGGSNEKENLVALTAREHFICHLLLTKMLNKPHVCKMIFAAWRMSNSTPGQRNLYNVSGRSYERLRLDRKNIKMSAETKAKLRATKKENPHPAWNKGIPRTKEEKALMSKRRKEVAAKNGAWNKGRAHPVETLAKIAAKAKMRTKKTCPHCTKSVSPSNYARWHGDNCRPQHR